MKRSSTVFLRLVVTGLGLVVLALCVLVLPEIAREWPDAFPSIAIFHYPVLLGLLITAISFYGALYHTMKLLGYIDKNNAFSVQSIKALRNIKYHSSVISGIYLVALPLIYYIAEIDDAPGLILVGVALAFAPMTIAVFAAVLERVLRSAIDIKSENDLTV